MKTKNYTQKHNTLHIPTREEFHRYASNTLSEEDFCTDYPGHAGYQIDKVASSIRWTKSNARKHDYSIKRKIS